MFSQTALNTPASDTVTTSTIADANVTSAKLASNAVTTVKITDANVTTAKLADNAVTTAKIADDAVTSAKLDTNISIAGTLASTGVLTANAGVVVDNITIDGTEIDLSSGDLTIDVAGNIILNADSDSIKLADGSTEFGKFYGASNNFYINSVQQDKDIIFVGDDGGSSVTALTLDMSEAGQAIFNSGIEFGGGLTSPSGSNINVFSGSAINLGTSASTRLHIDTSGRVGIGTTSPQTSTKGLHVVHDATEGTPSFPDGEVIIAQRNFNSSQGCHIGIIAGTASESAINFGDKDDSDIGNITYNHSSNHMSFTTNTSEKMRIDTSGFLFIGQTTRTESVTNGGVYIAGDVNVGSTNYYAQMYVQHDSATNHGIVIDELATGGSGIAMGFRSGSTVVGTITVNSSSTTYNTSSDYRLKENVVEMTGAIDRVNQLQPKRFNFITDADTTVDGFLAHEVSSIVPEAISGKKDAVDGQGNPEYQGIDHSKLVPLLTKAIQEQQEQIETLKAEVKELKDNG